MKMSVKLDLDKVVFDKDNKLHMLASLEAPAVQSCEKRNPLCIVAVLDRSGSMGSGLGGDHMTKLDYVKRSMYKLIDHMTEEDSLGLVFFDDQIRYADFRKMTSANKEVMRQEVANVYARGSTDIGSAVAKAGSMFASYEGGVKSVERIMLLTDGDANIGAVSPEHFIPIVGGIRNGVSVSCFGYGDRFNELLMTEISKQGKGNNYYIENPDSVAKVFAVELGGLLTCYAQDIVLTIKTHKGAVVSNVLNDLDVETKQDADGELVTQIKIGDIYAGEKRDVVVKFDFEKRGQALPRPVTLADVSLSYRAMSDAQTKNDSDKAKVRLVKTASEATQSPDADIADQVAILEAAIVMAEAKKMADQGRWSEAKSFIVKTSGVLRSRGSAKTVNYAGSMDALADSLDASYTAGNNLSKGMGSFSYATTSCRAMHSVGNTAGDMMGFCADDNVVMKSMVDSFTADDAKPVDPVATSGSVPKGKEDDVRIGTSTGNTGHYNKTRNSK